MKHIYITLMLSLIFVNANSQTITEVTSGGINNLRIIRSIGTDVYVTQFANAAFDSSSGKVIKLDTTNNTVSDVITGILFPVGLDTDGANLYQGSEDSNEGVYEITGLNSSPTRSLIDTATGLTSCAVVYDNQKLYFVSANNNAVYSLDLTNSSATPQVVFQSATMLNFPETIAKNGNDLYIGTNNGQIVRVNIAGTVTASNYFNVGFNQIHDMRVWNGYLYYNGRPGAISRIDLSAAPSAEVFVNSSDIWSFTFVGNTMYIVSGDSSFNTTISRVDGLNLNTVDFKAKDEAKLYPNPARDYLFIKSNSKDYKSYEIYSVAGVVIKRGKIDSNQSINVQSLQSGVYLVKYSSDEHSETRSFVKE